MHQKSLNQNQEEANKNDNEKKSFDIILAQIFPNLDFSVEEKALFYEMLEKQEFKRGTSLLTVGQKVTDNY